MKAIAVARVAGAVDWWLRCCRRHGKAAPVRQDRREEMARDQLLVAIRYGLSNDWEGAHRLVQDMDGPEAAWVHAWLHRIEGDIGNAGYWYRLAGKPLAKGSTQVEGEAIAAALSAKQAGS
jgi:hypothetical protein